MKTCPYPKVSRAKLAELANIFSFQPLSIALTAVVQQPLLDSNHPEDGLGAPGCPPPIITELITNHSLYNRLPQ